jgi:alpha-tubulin suppressor-like RCC1 family protein
MDIGGNSACALLTDGTAKCWGNNAAGGLGDGTTVDRNLPVAVLSVASATSVSYGNYAGCALNSDGSVKCWGDNGYGQLGDGTTTSRSTAAPVSGGAIFYK